MQLSFSQIKYPQKWVVENDTLVVITEEQLAIANSIIVERNIYRDSLVPLYKNLTMWQDSVIQVLNLQIDSWAQMEQINKGIIASIEQREKQSLLQKKKQTWIIGGICVGVGFTAGILIFGLCK